MKKLFKLFIAMMAVILPLASCSDDSDDSKDKDIDLAKSFKSEYVGELSISIDGISLEPTKETVLVSSKEANTIDLSLKNFMLDNDQPMPVGNIDIEGIKLTGNKDEVVFTISQNIIIKDGDTQGVDAWLGPMIKDGIIPATITGTLKNGKLDINIAIDLKESLGQIINVNFKG